jgi:hypothetical protein
MSSTSLGVLGQAGRWHINAASRNTGTSRRGWKQHAFAFRVVIDQVEDEGHPHRAWLVGIGDQKVRTDVPSPLSSS